MELHGFELIKEQIIPEINSSARLFRHKKSGARLLSVENDDENKVFGISFRTPPPDSSGIAHIMEHSVLCGSQKYPLKEPFIELVKGSLKTFLNAFTYPDKTCYPVASQNTRDFYNLIDVYMDAVLHPLIPEYVLDQEGWHYEVENEEDPFIYKGVVFNEMKGAYSDADQLITRYSQMTLFPDTPYGFSSGGDPKHIPDLTYDQFKAFYDLYYHPSNSYIFIYGDDDPEERLRLMNDYLAHYERIDTPTGITLQEPFAAPKTITRPYDAGKEAGGKQSKITLTWLLPEGNDAETVLSMAILNHILIATPASPLRKALIDSGLGEDLIGVGLENELRQMFFSTGLKGIASKDAGKVEQLIMDTLNTLVGDGIDQDMVAAAVNTTEFRLRENNTGMYPRGLMLMLQALTTWLYDGDPITALAFAAPLASIKEKVAGGGYFEEMIQRHLIENPHRVTLLLEPDTELRAREDEAEKARLAEARAGMDSQQIKEQIENTRRLKEIQDTVDPPEVLAMLPSLELNDLDKQGKTIPIEESKHGSSRILHHDLFTNGILYLDIGFDLRTLPQDLLPFAGILGAALLEMGTEKEDYVKLSQRIGRDTGGITPSLLLSSIRGSDDPAAWFFLRGKATVDQSGRLLDILKDLLLTAKLDHQERFRQIILERKARRESQLVPSGHMVVDNRLASRFSLSGWAAEQLRGLDSLFFLRGLVERVESDWPGVLAQLEQTRELLVNAASMLCNVTVDAENWAKLQSQVAALIDAIPVAEQQLNLWRPTHDAADEGLTIPAQVNYVGKGVNLYQQGYAYDGSQLVVRSYLRSTWLWEKVRVQGGAYGGFSTFNPLSGTLNFISYRDPNLLATLDIYDQTSQFLNDLDLDKRELSRSIIGAIGEIDAYQLPDAKGYTSMQRFLTGVDDEYRQSIREQVLTTKLSDFKHYGAMLKKALPDGRVVVLGGVDGIEAANRQKDGFLEVKKVM